MKNQKLQKFIDTKILATPSKDEACQIALATFLSAAPLVFWIFYVMFKLKTFQ